MQTPPGLCNCSDPDDASVARSDEYLRELFKRADLKLLYSAVQKGAQPLHIAMWMRTLLLSVQACMASMPQNLLCCGCRL